MRKSDHTKRKIRSAALYLFNTKGLSDTTLRTIAGSAGIAYGNLTYYYSSKKNLVYELYKEGRLHTEELSNSLATITEPQKRLFALITRGSELALRYRFLFLPDTFRTSAATLIDFRSDRMHWNNYFASLLLELDAGTISEANAKTLADALLMQIHWFNLSAQLEGENHTQLHTRFLNHLEVLLLPHLSATAQQDWHTHREAR